MPSGSGLHARLALALSSTLVTLGLVWIAGEGAVHYRERHRTTVPGTTPTIFYRHARLRHALERDTDYFGWLHVNPQGFRGSRATTREHPGVLRLMVVGGSTTFDSFVSGDDRTWPARLQHYLDSMIPGRPVEVVNAGTPGYRLTDNLIRLQTELFQYTPDVILYYEAHNDIFADLGGRTRRQPSRRPDEVEPMSGLRYWLSRHSLLYAKVAGKVNAIRFRGRTRDDNRARQGGDRADSVLSVGTREFERQLAVFVAVARVHGIRVALADVVFEVVPNDTGAHIDEGRRRWRLTVPFADPASVMRAYQRYNASIAQVAAREGVSFITTAGFGLGSREWYSPGDVIHFNDAGADRMGRLMAAALVSQGVLWPDSPSER